MSPYCASYVSRNDDVIIYEPSFRDPVKFSFAVGGKDGVPKPVNVADYDRAIEFYSEVLRGTRELKCHFFHR